MNLVDLVFMWFRVFCLVNMVKKYQTLVLDWLLLEILTYWSLFILFGGVLF